MLVSSSQFNTKIDMVKSTYFSKNYTAIETTDAENANNMSTSKKSLTDSIKENHFSAPEQERSSTKKSRPS